MSDTSPEPSLESLRPKGPLTAPKPEPPADAPERAPEVDPTIEALTIGHATFYLRYADLLPPLTAEEYAGLRASIEAHGIQQAIVVHRLTRTHIDVVDGAHRLRIAHELGLDLAAIPLNFLMAATSEEDQRALAWSLNADRRHLTKEQRQARALELRKEGLSYRAIGEQLGVGRMTAKRDVEEAVVPHGTSELPETITTADGKTRPATQPKPAATLEVAEVDTAREFIIDALRRKYSPLSRGQLYRDAARIAGASGIKRAAFDAALDAMLEAGSVREHINHHGAREYHFADVVGRLERGEAAAPQENDPPARHKPKTNHGNGEHVSQGIDACQTPPYALKPLLPYLDGDWEVWEPAAGKGRMVDALRDAEFDVIASDIIGGKDFFEYQPESFDCIVTNPPYSLKYKWLERCYALGKPFALLLPVETLGAKTAQTLFREHGISVIFMDRRINFEMPNIGLDGSNAQFPTAWFVWGIELPSQMIFAEL